MTGLGSLGRQRLARRFDAASLEYPHQETQTGPYSKGDKTNVKATLYTYNTIYDANIIERTGNTLHLGEWGDVREFGANVRS